MAEGAPKAPVVAEAHEVDTFREYLPTHLSSPPPPRELISLASRELRRKPAMATRHQLTTSLTDPPAKMLESKYTWRWGTFADPTQGGTYLPASLLAHLVRGSLDERKENPRSCETNELTRCR